MLARENILLLDLVYGTETSTRVPSRYSLWPMNRNPPLEISSQATMSSSPEYRTQAVIFILVRLFLRRSSACESVEGGFGFCSGGFPSCFFAASRLLSLQALVELQILQERISSALA